MIEFEPGHLISGRYEVIRLLGEGGMAQVYQAFDTRLERTVAVKVQYATSPKFVERFRREARALASLTYSGVVQVHHFDCEGNFCYIDMEYVAGATLRDLLNSVAPSPLPLEDAIHITIQIATALKYAHDKGLVHRDIKPSNVLIDERNGAVKVVDFGIARGTEDSSLTATGMLMGTADYVSPEQAQGDPATPQSDIYSIGVILYEMLTGQRPFKSDTVKGLLFKHITEIPKRPSDLNPSISPQLETVVMRALEKDPEQRFISAAEMIQELNTCLPTKATLLEPTLDQVATVAGELETANETNIDGSNETRMVSKPTGQLETGRILTTEERVGPDAPTQVVRKSQPDAPTEEVSDLIKVKEAKARRRAIAWVASLLGLGLLTAIGLFIILTPTITNNPIVAVSTPSVTTTAFAGQLATLPVQATDTPLLLPTHTLLLPIDTPLPLPTDTSLPIPTDTLVPPPTDTTIPTPEAISVANAKDIVPVRAIGDYVATIESVIFSPDGQYLVAATGVGSSLSGLGDYFGSVVVRRVESDRIVSRINPRGRSPFDLAFSADGGTLLVLEMSYPAKTELVLYDMGSVVSQPSGSTPSGSYPGSFQEPAAFERFALSRDLSTFVVTEFQRAIKVRREPGEVQIHTLRSCDHVGCISDLVFSPDSLTLAVAMEDGAIDLWNIKEGLRTDALDGHAGSVGRIAFSQDSQIIASSGEEDNTIKLWKNGKLWHELMGHVGSASELTFSPDGTILASGSYNDKTVRLWDVETGALLKSLDGQVSSLAFSPDGRTLAGAIEETVQLWEVR